jgi:hypothetical protein
MYMDSMIIDLAKYRIEKVNNDLQASRIMLGNYNRKKVSNGNIKS